MGKNSETKKRVLNHLKMAEINIKKYISITIGVVIILILLWFATKSIRGAKANEYMQKNTKLGYLEAEALTPFSPLMHYKLGIVYQEEGFGEKAEKEFKKTITLCQKYEWRIKNCKSTPEYKLALFNLKKQGIEQAVKNGDTPKLQNSLAETLELGENDPAANFWLSFLYAASGDYILAKESLKNQSENNSDVIEKRVILKESLTKLASLPKSVNKKDEYSPFLIGLTFLKMNYPKFAIPQFEKALDIEPKYRDAMVELGRTYLILNQPQKAIEVFNKAIKIDPVYPETFSLLSDAYEKTKNQEKAQEAREKTEMLTKKN